MKFRNAWMKYYAEADGDGGDLGGDGGGTAVVDGDSGDAGGSGADDGAGTTQADWPADWRTKLSPDGKHSKTLDRFASPNALMDSYLALRQKLDSGELKANVPFPAKGTPEEQNAWRKSVGIPEKPEEYALKFADGLVIGDADKPIIDDFLKAAHGVNASPDQVNGLVKWYYDHQEAEVAKREEADADYLQKNDDALRAEWGGEYRANVNMIKGLVATLPESVRDLFLNARLGDGNALLNNPDMARWLVSTARTLNPVATVVPGAGANVAGAIDDEIDHLEGLMKANSPEYWKSEKNQARLRDLYDARAKVKA